MFIKILQSIIQWWFRHFVCNHVWVSLRHHNLPNEPYLIQCKNCRWITRDWNLLLKE